MSRTYLRCFFLLLAFAIASGCSHYQPTKNVWKTTKGLWSTYVSPPASVDYDDKGNLPPQAEEISRNMMGVDTELVKLERIMQNADKPPTQEWLDKLFASFPWLDGFAGIKYNGVILGQQPENSLKELDFNPLLYEDKKQSSRALRADVQPSPLGPEIMLATPLYDGVDFLGIVVAYFDMRSLMKFSENAANIVVLCPTALLWPGKYDFSATPLAGVNWGEVVTKSTSGSCSNANGSFFYQVRYLGNLPLIFAVPEKGNFAEGNGSLEQGAAFFPQEREKMPPPDLPERKPRKEAPEVTFGQSEDADIQAPQQPEDLESQERQAAPSPTGDRRPSPNEIQPGSHDSMLLKKGAGDSRRELKERPLEGENVEVERVQRPRVPRRPQQQIIIDEPIDILPDNTAPAVRPSPFGPREEEAPAREGSKPYTKPSPFGPGEETPPAEQPAATQTPDNQDRLADGEKAEPSTQPAPETASPAPAESENSGTDAGREGKDAASAAPAEPERHTPARMPDGRPSPFGPN